MYDVRMNIKKTFRGVTGILLLMIVTLNVLPAFATTETKYSARSGSLNNFGKVIASDGDWMVVVGVMTTEIWHGSAGHWNFYQTIVNPADIESASIFDSRIVLASPITGFAYIYRLDYSSGTWSHEMTITGSDTTSVDDFGQAVAFVNDHTLVVGAPQHGVSGQAYVFNLISGVWTESTILTSRCGTGCEFGGAIAPAEETLFIAATGPGQGRVDIFRQLAGTWTVVDVIEIPAYSLRSPELIQDIAVNDLGTTLAIGDVFAASGLHATGSHTLGHGAVYVYELQTLGTPAKLVWQRRATLLPTLTQTWGYFGSSVDIINNKILIGAPGYDTPTGVKAAGTAFAFVRDTSGTWNLTNTFSASDAITSTVGEAFGNAVAFSDQNSMFVAAYRKDSSAGAVYQYQP